MGGGGALHKRDDFTWIEAMIYLYSAVNQSSHASNWMTPVNRLVVHTYILLLQDLNSLTVQASWASCWWYSEKFYGKPACSQPKQTLITMCSTESRQTTSLWRRVSTRFCRHPAYVGWFYWSIGTQVGTLTICINLSLSQHNSYYNVCVCVHHRDRTIECIFIKLGTYYSWIWWKEDIDTYCAYWYSWSSV